MAWTAPATATVGQVLTANFWNQQVRDNFKAGFAVGDYKYVARATAGYEVANLIDGAWLECNHAAVNRTTYSEWDAYVAALSPVRPFGAGDGSTTVNLPDLFGRVPVSMGSHGDVNAFADSDGVASGNRSPKHNATVTDAGHYHPIRQSNASGSNAYNVPNDTAISNNWQTSNMRTENAYTGVTVGPGGTLPVDTPAYQVSGIWIVKVKS